MKETAADNNKIIAIEICKDLLKKNMFAVGITANNNSYLKIDFLVIHFSCSTHTAQLSSDYFEKIVRFMTC